MSMDAHRRQRLTAVLDAEGLDALVGTTPENVHYVTGFRSVSARPLPRRSNPR
jgi:Xaa-Pro aminopeptidase